MQAGALIELDGGAYRLAAPIAASSYGVVWRASRCADGLAVAVKLVNHDQMRRAHPALQARWIDSAVQETAFLRSLAPWDARHIVRLLDSGEHAGLPALALELLGPDLGRHAASLRAQQQSAALGRVFGWIGQINQALAKVHQYGWSYLDLKPANLLLAPADASVRLSDFGACRPLGAGPTRSYAGTAAWQAPEQFFPGPEGYAVSPRSDYFSLGTLLYYLVCAGPLEYCRSLGSAWRLHGAAAPARVPAGLPTLTHREAASFEQAAGPAALALLRRLLARAPAQRPDNALEISRMLATIDLHAEVCA